MNKYGIKTPSEVDYQNNEAFDKVMLDIASKINNKIFKFKPAYPHELFKSRINQELNTFGWKIEGDYVGTKDEGYFQWVIKPL